MVPGWSDCSGCGEEKLSKFHTRYSDSPDEELLSGKAAPRLPETRDALFLAIPVLIRKNKHLTLQVELLSL